MRITNCVIVLLLFAITLTSLKICAQESTTLLSYIRDKSEIKEGGSNLYHYQDTTYIISVAYLTVGTKNENDCKIVGAAKAKKEMLSFINGSDITSYTELKVSEKEVDTLDEKIVESVQEYTEVVKERVIGTINQTLNLGGWYSNDGSVYYFAIYKIINQ